jgi:hypothetical protein
MSGERRRRSRWSGAEAALALAWASFATGLLAVAFARGSAGVLAIAVFCAWQLADVWTGVHTGEPASGDAVRTQR